MDNDYYLLIKGAKINNNTDQRANLLFGELNQLNPRIDTVGLNYSSIPINEYDLLIKSLDEDELLCNYIAFVSKKLVYYIQMNNSNEFEVKSSSNILGRSQLNLLQIKKRDNSWIVEGSHIIKLSEQLLFKSFDEMLATVLNLLDELGDPYQNDYRYNIPANINLSFNIDTGTVIVNGNHWFSF
jgi:hypothetical protein